MGWLVDGSGKLWPEEAHPIARWDVASDPLTYAVSDLGFIHLSVLNGGVKVSFNPSRIAPRTMISAFYVIAGEQPKRIALSFGDQSPDIEIFGTVGAALRRIEELVQIRPSTIPMFARRRLFLDRQPTHIIKPITEILETWKNTADQWTLERYANLSRTVPLNDIVVVRNACGTSSLVYDYWGDSGDIFGAHWVRIARGKHVEDQPFPEHGKRMACLYRRTLAKEQPDLKEVDITFSEASGKRSCYRYARLLLPWSTPRGDRYVTLIRFDRDSVSPK